MRRLVVLVVTLGVRALAQEPAAPDAPRSADDRLSFDRTVNATIYKTEISFAVFRGPGKERLEYADFYRLVGRADLATRYTFWQRTRVVLGASAITMSAAGLLVGVWPFAVSCEGLRTQPAAFEQCRQSWARTTLPAHLITGAALIAVGQVLGGIAGGINPQPVTYDEAKALGEAWNSRLGVLIGPGGVGVRAAF